MCIKRVEAWEYAGKTYSSEGQAITAAIAKRCNIGEAMAQQIIDKASDVIPLLNRIVEIEVAKSRAKTAAEDDGKDPPADDYSYSGPDINSFSRLEM